VVKPVEAVGEAGHDPWRPVVVEPVEAPELQFVETLEPAVLAVRESWAAVRRSVRSRGRRAVEGRHRRIALIVGAVVAVAAVVVAVLLPLPGDGEATSSGLPPETTAVSPSPSEGASSVVRPLPGYADPGADPVAAVTELLADRAACLDGEGDDCLERVESRDSPAFAQDQARAARTVGPIRWTAA
jgi:hypothetical protein